MYVDLAPEHKALRDQLRGYFVDLVTDELREELRDSEGGGPEYHRILRQLGRDGWLGSRRVEFVIRGVIPGGVHRVRSFHRLLFTLVLFQHRIGFEDGLNLGLQFKGRKLQQAIRLLQLGGHGQDLTDFELYALLHVPGSVVARPVVLHLLTII